MHTPVTSTQMKKENTISPREDPDIISPRITTTPISKGILSPIYLEK